MTGSLPLRDLIIQGTYLVSSVFFIVGLRGLSSPEKARAGMGYAAVGMLLAIAGTLIHVGRGRWSPEDMRRILETGDRTHAGETAPPQGLYLMQVAYDEVRNV